MTTFCVSLLRTLTSSQRLHLHGLTTSQSSDCYCTGEVDPAFEDGHKPVHSIILRPALSENILNVQKATNQWDLEDVLVGSGEGNL